MCKNKELKRTERIRKIATRLRVESRFIEAAQTADKPRHFWRGFVLG